MKCFYGGDLELAKEDFSPNQLWYFSNNVLFCGNGFFLEVEGFPCPGARVLGRSKELPEIWRKKQEFYFKKISDEKFFIGRFAEKEGEKEEENETHLFLGLVEIDHPSYYGRTVMKPFMGTIAALNPQLTWEKVFTDEAPYTSTVNEDGTRTFTKKICKKKEDDGRNKEESLNYIAGLNPEYVWSKVLTEVDQPYKWVEMDTDELPEDALAAGKDENSDTFNVFAARGYSAEVDGVERLRVGKVLKDKRKIEYENEEKEVTTEKFSVLCVEPDAEVEWVEYDYDIPAGSVIAGIIDGEICYVGRGQINNTIMPGLFNHRAPLFVLSEGELNEVGKLELLVVKKKSTPSDDETLIEPQPIEVRIIV